MNKILLATMIVGIIAIIALGTFNLVKANLEKNNACSVEFIQNPPECQNKCTAENNCGISGCGALEEKSCGCS